MQLARGEELEFWKEEARGFGDRVWEEESEDETGEDGEYPHDDEQPRKGRRISIGEVVYRT